MKQHIHSFMTEQSGDKICWECGYVEFVPCDTRQPIREDSKSPFKSDPDTSREIFMYNEHHSNGFHMWKMANQNCTRYEDY